MMKYIKRAVICIAASFGLGVAAVFALAAFVLGVLFAGQVIGLLSRLFGVT